MNEERDFEQLYYDLLYQNKNLIKMIEELQNEINILKGMRVIKKLLKSMEV